MGTHSRTPASARDTLHAMRLYVTGRCIGRRWMAHAVVDQAPGRFCPPTRPVALTGFGPTGSGAPKLLWRFLVCSRVRESCPTVQETKRSRRDSHHPAQKHCKIIRCLVFGLKNAAPHHILKYEKWSGSARCLFFHVTTKGNAPYLNRWMDKHMTYMCGGFSFVLLSGNRTLQNRINS